MATHPRQFRVERITPGVTWSGWTFTYHPTIEAANKAIGRFFRGEGNYRSSRNYSRPHTDPHRAHNRDSRVKVTRRHEARRLTFYTDVVFGLTYAQWAHDELSPTTEEAADACR